MKNTVSEISISAVIMLALLYYIALPEEFAALLAAVFVHEMGHLSMLWILGMNIKSIRADMKGLCINYWGETGYFGHILAAAAGPAAGFLYAFAVSGLAKGENGEFFCLSAGLSLILSLFNLLPAFPLDGGHISYRICCLLFGAERGESLSTVLSFLTALMAFLAGIFLLADGRGAGLLISSIWLLFYQDAGRGIVKKREML